MKYTSAQTVLPKHLLDEIQKYVQGELLYIPKPAEKRLKWGANTDTKDMLAQRNREIVHTFQSGVTIPQLASTYYLSEETIKKIVYRAG